MALKDKIFALQARRAARGMSDPLNVLRAIVAKAKTDGAEMATEQVTKEVE